MPADYPRMRTAVVLILVAVVARPAYTASSDVPDAPAGAGAAAVSGYAVSAISYSLDGGTIDGVSFTLAPASARTAKVRLAPAEPWSDCTVAGGSASCPVETELSAATALEVVAAS